MQTIIVPAYNEESIIAETVSTLMKHFDEVIVVSDGQDRTAEKAEEAGAIVFEFSRRLGKGAAIKYGIRHSSGDVVGFVDADLPFSVSDIKRVFKYAAGGMSVGWRFGWHRVFHRNVGRIALNSLSSLLHGYFPDYQTGLKAFDRSFISIALSARSNGYFFDTELVYLFRKNNIPVIPIRVDWNNRPIGKPVWTDSIGYAVESLSFAMRRL